MYQRKQGINWKYWAPMHGRLHTITTPVAGKGKPVFSDQNWKNELMKRMCNSENNKFHDVDRMETNLGPASCKARRHFLPKGEQKRRPTQLNGCELKQGGGHESVHFGSVLKILQKAHVTWHIARRKPKGNRRKHLDQEPEGRQPKEAGRQLQQATTPGSWQKARG